jgi:hypothetical protein
MNYSDQLNVAQASKACGVSEMTIRKYLGITNPPQPTKLPNARKEVVKGKSVWVIPITDLVASGLMDKVTGEVARTANSLGNQIDSLTATSQELQELRAELEKLKVELAGKDQLIALYDQQLTLANRLQIETSQVQEARRKGFWRK